MNEEGGVNTRVNEEGGVNTRINKEGGVNTRKGGVYTSKDE